MLREYVVVFFFHFKNLFTFADILSKVEYSTCVLTLLIEKLTLQLCYIHLSIE